MIIIFSITTSYSNFEFLEEQNTEIQSYLSGINSIEYNKNILPIYNGNWGRINPLNHAWAYYHIYRGGTGPYVFARTGFSPVEFKINVDSFLKSPGMFTPERITTNILENYEYVIVYNIDNHIQSILEESFYIPIHKNKTTVIYQTNNDFNTKGPTT